MVAREFVCMCESGILKCCLLSKSKIEPFLENTNRGHQDLILGELLLEPEVPVV